MLIAMTIACFHFLIENITGECEDKSTGCRDFAAQSYYCKHRKMREICPRSCGYCGEYWCTRSQYMPINVCISNVWLSLREFNQGKSEAPADTSHLLQSILWNMGIIRPLIPAFKPLLYSQFLTDL